MSSNKNSEDINSETVKTRGNAIVRQELNSLTPRCNATFAIIINSILIIIFLFFGIPILIYSANKIEYRKLYTDKEW